MDWGLLAFLRFAVLFITTAARPPEVAMLAAIHAAVATHIGHIVPSYCRDGESCRACFERLTRLRVPLDSLQNPQVSPIHAAPDFVLKGEA
jgi:hypothetical protein